MPQRRKGRGMFKQFMTKVRSVKKPKKTTLDDAIDYTLERLEKEVEVKKHLIADNKRLTWENKELRSEIIRIAAVKDQRLHNEIQRLNKEVSNIPLKMPCPALTPCYKQSDKSII